MSITKVNTQGRVIDDPVTTQDHITASGFATGTCAICGGAAKTKYCGTACYRVWQRSRPLEERFWPRVNKNGPLHPYDPALGRCWLWTGTRCGRDGYGGIYVAHHQVPGSRHPKPSYVHRVVWELAHGPIAEGQHILHSCDRRNCVNAAHLFLGNQDANMKDAAAKGRLHVPRPRARKVTDEQIAQMFVRRQQGLTLEAIAAEFHVTESYVSFVLRGLRRSQPVQHQQASGF